MSKNKDTDILVQIREEKEREFNKFMEGVKTYLTEDPKTVEEVEFKKGMEGYLSLINDDRNNSNLGKAQPSIKLNIVSKLKSNIFDGKEIQTEKKISPKVNELRKDQLNLSFTKTESATSNKLDLNRTSEKTQQAKQMFENKTGGIIRQVTT